MSLPAPAVPRFRSLLRFTTLAATVALLMTGAAAADRETKREGAERKKRTFTAAQVFDQGKVILFQDDFTAPDFGPWKFSQNADYDLTRPDPDRIRLVDAPGLPAGRKAVKFVVTRGPNSFRSELALPHEAGCHERWYAARVLIPSDWVIDDQKGDDIVLQWHGIPGNWRATFPNLALSINGSQWWIKQNYGAAQTGPTRTAAALKEPLQPGAWVAWVIHAKWSTKADGLLEIWRDGKLVHSHQGPNLYTTIGTEYTPYLKTGIYHPTWNLKTPERQQAFAQQSAPGAAKVVYVTDVKVGGERARYDDVVPRPLR
jgi:hypothetical protein